MGEPAAEVGAVLLVSDRADLPLLLRGPCAAARPAAGVGAGRRARPRPGCRCLPAGAARRRHRRPRRAGGGPRLPWPQFVAGGGDFAPDARRRSRWRRSRAAPTTTSAGRSIPRKSWRGCAPCCAASASIATVRPAIAEAGGVRLECAARRARVEGASVDLTAVEFDLLEYLVRHAGRKVLRDDLTRAAWGRQASPLDRSLDVHISRLRRKLKPGGARIVTVRGVGYLLAVAPPRAAGYAIHGRRRRVHDSGVVEIDSGVVVPGLRSRLEPDVGDALEPRGAPAPRPASRCPATARRGCGGSWRPARRCSSPAGPCRCRRCPRGRPGRCRPSSRPSSPSPSGAGRPPAPTTRSRRRTACRRCAACAAGSRRRRRCRRGCRRSSARRTAARPACDRHVGQRVEVADVVALELEARAAALADVLEDVLDVREGVLEDEVAAAFEVGAAPTRA